MRRKPPAFATSIRWQSVNVVSQVLLQLVFIMLLARLISKADFGVMSIALVVVGFIEIFAQIGIGPSLIQRKNLQPENIRAAFHFSLALGGVFFAMMYGAAPWVGAWFNSDTLTEVLRWIAFSFILSSIALVPRSLLIRQMQFKRLFLAALFSMALGNLGIGLGLAYAGYGIWAYVGALLSQNALLGMAYWIIRPDGSRQIWGAWSWPDLRSMLVYGGKSTVFNWLNYTSTKVDTLIVGEFNQSHAASTGGWSSTGVYDRSAHLMSLPITILGKLGDSVLFSGMSALQSDAKALNRVLVRGLGLIAWVIFPGSLALAWFSTEVAVILLGEEYIEAGSVVRVLFLGVGFRSLIKLADAVVRATDRLVPAIAIKSLYLIGLSGSAWWTMQRGLGIEGVAWAVTGCTLLQFVVYFSWMTPALKLPWSTFFRSIAPGLSGLILAAPGYWVIGSFGFEWIDQDGTLVAWALGVQVALVVCWSILVWTILAMRNPAVLDGGDEELRTKWTAYLPKWSQKLIRK